MRLAMIRARMKEFTVELDSMGKEGRQALVQGARLSDRWRSDGDVLAHQRKHAPNLGQDEYRAWAQTVKNRAGVEVYAYIHSIKLTRGVAFVDHDENTVVWFSLEEGRNLSVFHPDEGTRRFIDNKPEYKRLKETEL